MSRLSDLQNALQRQLGQPNKNRASLAGLLRDCVHSGFHVKIRCEQTNWYRLCDGPSCVNPNESFLESDMIRPLSCEMHILCRNCFLNHVDQKLRLNPYLFGQISCPRCEAFSRPQWISVDLILQHFQQEYINNLQQMFQQNIEDYANQSVYILENEQPNTTQIISIELEDDVKYGDATEQPPPHDHSPSAEAFRECFAILRSSANNHRVSLASNMVIINPRARLVFNQLKATFKATSIRAISLFMTNDESLNFIHSPPIIDSETGFIKLIKKLTEDPIPESRFVDCEILVVGSITPGKPKKSDLNKTQHPKVFADEEFYYIDKAEGILVKNWGSVG